MSISSSKKNNFTEIRILKLCLKYYLSDVKNIKLMFCVLISSILAKHVISYFLKKLIYDLNSTNNLTNDCQIIFICHILYSIFSSSSQYIILCCSTLFQSNTSKRALLKILKYEAGDSIDLSSGKTQFAISEGSLAMSKLFEHCILELLQKVGYFISDFLLIYRNTSKIHLYFCFFIVILAIFIHIKGAMVAMKCKKDMNSARGICDKLIYEDITNYEIIKSFQTEDYHLEDYNNKLNLWKAASLKHNKTVVLLSFMDDIIFLLAAFISILILQLQNVSNPVKYRNIYDSFLSLEKTIENISGIFRKYKEALVTSKLILYYLEVINEEVKGTSVKDTFKKEIVFRNVGYSINGIQIFKNINFVLKKGDKACIFGKNGSGKSTISKILTRLCYIDSGSVTIDDIDIYEILITKYRKLITYVPQETILFDESVVFNLSYGNNEPFASIVEECKKMGIHKDILKLEDGYNTILGERGLNINGGLRQKIFYVRALLSKAQVYIFDEPTNNLDEKSSNNVIDLILGERFFDKTVLVVCHDYGHVKKFPKIFTEVK